MAIGQREVADRELIGRTEQGDRDAFASLYQRHFQGLYDFALRIVRDTDLAGDVVQSTFVKAWEAAQKQKGVDNVKAWLYTIAHNLAIDELRLRKRLAEPRRDESWDEEGFPFAIPDPSRLSDPENVVRDRELVELVWSSAAALNPQEYALLDLHLRRELDADELAEQLGLDKGAVYTRLSRLRNSLEESVVTTLMLRRGRRECPELDALLGGLRASEASQPVRSAVREHLKTCERCQESKRRFVSPAEIFAGLTLVPVSLEQMEAMWARIAAEIGLVAGAVAGAGAAAATGDSGASASTATTTKGVAVSALATGAAIVLATALVFRGDEGVDDPGDVRSTTHAVGQPSRENVVRMGWSPEGDADAYSISWARDRDLPDAIADVDGDATGATSPPLAPGSWYFNLRTRGDGEWTSTVHVGPFEILGDAAAKPQAQRLPRVIAPRSAKPRIAVVRGVELGSILPVVFPSLTAVAGVSETREAAPGSFAGGRTDTKASTARRTPGPVGILLSPPPPTPPAPQPPSVPQLPPPPPPAPPVTTTTDTGSTTTSSTTTQTSTQTTTTQTDTTTTTSTSTTTTKPDDDEDDGGDDKPPPPPPPAKRSLIAASTDAVRKVSRPSASLQVERVDEWGIRDSCPGRGRAAERRRRTVSGGGGRPRPVREGEPEPGRPRRNTSPSGSKARLTGTWAVPPPFAVRALKEGRRSPSVRVQRPGFPSRGATSRTGRSALGDLLGNLPVFPDPFPWSASSGGSRCFAG